VKTNYRGDENDHLLIIDMLFSDEKKTIVPNYFSTAPAFLLSVFHPDGLRD